MYAVATGRSTALFSTLPCSSWPFGPSLSVLSRKRKVASLAREFGTHLFAYNITLVVCSRRASPCSWQARALQPPVMSLESNIVINLTSSNCVPLPKLLDVGALAIVLNCLANGSRSSSRRHSGSQFFSHETSHWEMTVTGPCKTHLQVYSVNW